MIIGLTCRNVETNIFFGDTFGRVSKCTAVFRDSYRTGDSYAAFERAVNVMNVIH